jgi:hypothetical protein
LAEVGSLVDGLGHPKEKKAWDVVLVTFAVTQTTSVIVGGRFGASRIVFRRKTTASRRTKCVLDPPNRPNMIEQGVWRRHNLHQSRLDQKIFQMASLFQI